MNVVTKDGVHYPFPEGSTVEICGGEWIFAYGKDGDTLAVFASSEVVSVVFIRGDIK